MFYIHRPYAQWEGGLLYSSLLHRLKIPNQEGFQFPNERTALLIISL